MVNKLENFTDILENINGILKKVIETPTNINYWGCYKKIKKLDLSSVEIPKYLKIRVALLSSFTIEPLSIYLDIECRKLGFFPELYIGGFNQFRQEILDPNSQYYNFKPDLTILAVNLEHFLGEFEVDFYNLSIDEKYTHSNKIISEINSLIKSIKSFSTGIVLINNFIEPTYSVFGIIDNKEELGLREFYQIINNNLINKYKKDEKIYIFDLNRVASDFGIKNIINPKMRYIASMEFSKSFLPHLVKEYISYVKALKGKTKKCIILDLDNTLWGGIIGEDGFNGIKLNNATPGNQFVDFQKALLKLNKRGILLAVNSKNNFDEAIEVIRDHPFMVLREKNFASMMINWDDKATNIIRIAKEIGIGLDSLVFIDDNPVERDLIKMTLPAVLVVELPSNTSLFIRALEDLNDFNLLSVTEEDKKRGAMYQARKSRKILEKSLNDIDEFLKTLDISIKIEKMNNFSFPRISNLIMKTNQFNLTTKRYSKTEIQKMAEESDTIIYSLSVRDRFGNEGIVGVAIIKIEEYISTIDSLLMSCRILGRKIENAFLYKIIEDMKKEGIKKIKGIYCKTEKNKLVCNFYKSNNFQLENESENCFEWILDLRISKFDKPYFITIEE